MNLYGWDTVYAVDIAVANRALAASASQLLHSLSQRVVGALGSYTVAATFGPWSILLGGSGELLDLQATITHGSVTPDGHAAVPLDGYVALFQLALRLLPPVAQQQKLVFDVRRAGVVGDAPAPGLVVPFGFVGKKPDPSVAVIALNGLAAGLRPMPTRSRLRSPPSTWFPRGSAAGLPRRILPMRSSTRLPPSVPTWRSCPPRATPPRCRNRSIPN